MKNVNKYYLFTRNDEFDIWTKLQNILVLNKKISLLKKDSISAPFDMVDMGKAEACIIIY